MHLLKIRFQTITLESDKLTNNFSGYSARAFGSADVENCHSIMNHLDKRGVGTSTLTELNRQISTLQTLQVLKSTSNVARWVK